MCDRKKNAVSFFFIKETANVSFFCTLIASIGFTFAEKGKHLIRRKKVKRSL